MENWCELDLWSSSIEFYFAVAGTIILRPTVSVSVNSSFKKAAEIEPTVVPANARLMFSNKMPHSQDKSREHMLGV